MTVRTGRRRVHLPHTTFLVGIGGCHEACQDAETTIAMVAFWSSSWPCCLPVPVLPMNFWLLPRQAPKAVSPISRLRNGGDRPSQATAGQQRVGHQRALMLLAFRSPRGLPSMQLALTLDAHRTSFPVWPSPPATAPDSSVPHRFPDCRSCLTSPPEPGPREHACQIARGWAVSLSVRNPSKGVEAR